MLSVVTNISTTSSNPSLNRGLEQNHCTSSSAISKKIQSFSEVKLRKMWLQPGYHKSSCKTCL